MSAHLIGSKRSLLQKKRGAVSQLSPRSISGQQTKFRPTTFAHIAESQWGERSSANGIAMHVFPHRKADEN